MSKDSFKEMISNSVVTEISGLTAGSVKEKMEESYRRLKDLYAEKHTEIEKNDEKIAKISEKLIVLKEEREILENELHGLKETYAKYCAETGMKPAFEN